MNKIISPSESEQKNALEFLKTCDLKSVSENILIEKIKFLSKGQETIAVRYSDLVLYRGILFNEKPQYYSDLIYPPYEKAKQNRASRSGEQMFYCSNLKKAPFYELSVKVGDRLVLSIWYLNKEAVFDNIGYTKSNLNSFKSSRKYTTIEVDENFIANGLGELFCKKITPEEIYYYKLTNAISQVYLFSDVVMMNYEVISIFDRNSDLGVFEPTDKSLKQFPGIVYPTIQNDGIGDNYAIKKEAIDDNLLGFQKVEYVEIVEVKENRYKYKIIDFANEIIDSRIMWMNLDRQWYLYDDTEDVNFVEDNGLFEAYTSDGNLIEPI